MIFPVSGFRALFKRQYRMKPEYTYAAVLREQGKPLSFERLKLPDLERGQVLVRIQYSTICQSQVNEMMGFKGSDPYLPHTLGHEGAGVVVATGPDVTRVSPDDRVILTWLKGSGISAKPASYLSGNEQVNSGPVSTFLTYGVVSEDRLLSYGGLPDTEEAPLFGCAIPTAYGMLSKELEIEKHHRLAILGAGGIGLSALILAKAMGVETVCAMDIRDESLERAKNFGADFVLNTSDSAFNHRLKEIMPQGFDFAIEATGRPEVMELALKVVRNFGGRVLIAGNARKGELLRLDPYEFIRGKTISGSWGGGCSLEDVMPDLTALCREGRLPVQNMITHEVSLKNINEGFELMLQGKGGRVRINHLEGADFE